MLPPHIGRYEILGELAVGGMAEILLGRVTGPSGFRRPVVVKRILRSYVRNKSYVTMFLDEARIVAGLNHPNVVQVQDLGQHEGEPFLVMEYVAGENGSGLLKRSVGRGEELDPVLAAHIVAEACSGLHAAHELTRADGTKQNLVHRDVSPQNLLVTYDGHVKLLDFGVALSEDRAARTEVGEIKGKIEYMSPEQVRGEPLDRRSDLFSLGIVLYELSTGRRLFQRQGHKMTIDALCTEPLVPPSRLVDGYPPRLEEICLRALARDRSERYATAAEMRKDLLEVTRALPEATESLASLMQRIFAERIVEKNEMLRRVGSGGDITRVPANETDDGVDVPNVTEVALITPPSPGPATGASAAAHALPGAAGHASPRRVGRLAVLIAAFVVGIGIALAARAFVVARSTRRAAQAVAPAAVAEPVKPAEVSVRVETKPAGARVAIGGVDRGETPLDLRLPAGDAPLRIDVHRSGYRALSQTVVPNRDQMLVLSMQPVAAPVVRSPTRAPQAAPPPAAPSGFRRFD